MGGDKHTLVSFGRSDPLHLTEATHAILGDGPTYVWGPNFERPQPDWAGFESPLDIWPLYDQYDVVYCGHGATLLEATAAGCEVMVLHWISAWCLSSGRVRAHTKILGSRKIDNLQFIPAWTGLHRDHTGNPVRWWESGSLFAMAQEIRERRLHAKETKTWRTSQWLLRSHLS